MLKAFLSLVITFTCVTCNLCFSQLISDDPSFSYTTSLDQNTGIFSAIKQDNKSQIVLLGGNRGIVKLDSTGKKITSFYQGTFPSGINTMKGLLETSDSKILAFGIFPSYQGHASKSLVRVLPNGVVDQTFVSSMGSNTYVEAVSEFPNGKYLCSIGYQGITNGIRRLNSDGTTDYSFASPYSGNLQHVAEFIIQADSSILVVFENFIQKLNYNGTINNSFNSSVVGPQGSSGYSDSEVLDDGKILFLSNNKVYRLLANGVIDNSFTPIVIPTSEFTTKRIVRTNDNKIYIFGVRDIAANVPYPLVKRYHLNGTIDNTFSLGQGFNYEYSGSINGLISFDDGSLSISGIFSGLNNVCATNIVMLNNSGSPVWMHKMGTGLVDYRAHTIHVDANNNIYVGGDFISYNGSLRNDITKLDRYGHIDYLFRPGTGFNGNVSDIITQPDGKIVVCGQFSSYNGTNIQEIVRLNPNGTIDNSFNTGTGFTGYSGDLWGLGIQSDGKIIVVGDFGSYNNVSVARIVRLLPNGSLDPTFTPSSGPNNQVLDLIVKPNDEILICGKFSSYAGTNRARVALLSSNGVLDNSFVPASAYAHNDVRTMAIQTDGKIVVGGDFGSYTDNQDRRVGRLNPSGSVDPTFVPNASMYNFPESIVVLPTGRIVIGSGRVSIVESNGTQVASSNLDLTMGGAVVNDMYVNPSGNPILVGRFLLNSQKSGISRLKLVPAIQQTQQVSSCVPFTWINGVTYTTSTTTPQYTFTNADGVDSIVSLHLTIGTSAVTDIQTACDSLTWIDGITYTMSTNTPTFTLQNAAGCDSIITLNLTITHSNGGTDIQTACDSYDWIDGNTYTSSTNTPTFTLQNAAGCDSIITLNLTITYSNSGTDIQTACDSYDWIDGNTYTSSTNTPTFVLQNAAGCDSTVTLNLTITHSTTGTDIQSACDSLSWIDGITYTTSTNTPTFTLQNASGCDSIITLNLTITYSSAVTDIQTACDSFTWQINGQTYTTSGQYIDTIPTATGCDSVITLNLTILNSSTGAETQTACGSYDWPINGQTYTASGQYTDTIPNAAGCDSIITLDLTIIPDLPLTIENSFSMPSDANSCTGEVAIDLSGNAPFELDFDNGSQVITSSGYSLITGLCAGTHDLHVTDNCGDTLSTTVVIPVDSNYVFNNPFIDSLAQDSLGVTLTNCDIYYAGIDTAYIDSIWANGNTVNVIWNIVDSNGSNFDTTTYVLNNGNGVYWLQLSVFCPNKSVGEYFTVTEAIYFNNGSVSTAGLENLGKDLFAIYPNPTNDQVHISFSGSDAELIVYDVQGKVVLKYHIQNNGIVSLENFERGVYLFDFKNSQGQSVQRVVKQ